MISDEELKKIIEEVIGNNDFFWNQPVYEIVKKIIDLPDGTETSITKLLGNSQLTSKQLFDIYYCVNKVCKKIGIILDFSKENAKVDGLPYNLPFKKVDERLKNVCVDNNNTINKAMDMTRMMNYRLHAEQLFIPVLNGFTVENDNNPQTILLASGDGFTEQLTSDGHLLSGEFEQRIDLVINNTKQFMKNSGCENAENSFIYYKDYNNGVFNFKIYVCDMIIPVNGEKKVIRQFMAYFEEPKMHDFYQLSLSGGPFTLPTEMLKIGVIDIKNDQVTMSLDNILKTLMDNLKYKN